MLTAPARLLALSIAASLAVIPLAAPTAAFGLEEPAAVDPMSLAEAATASGKETAELDYLGDVVVAPALAGTVSGTLLVGDGSGAYAPALSDSSYLRFWLWDEGTQLWNWVLDSDAFTSSGEFAVAGLEAGEYRIEFVSYDEYPVREYWEDRYTWFASDVVTLTDGSGLDLGTVSLDPSDILFDRIAGSTRYETAVAISQEIVPDGTAAPVVYLVNGLGYADALTAGPAASRAGGVMLLTAPTALPAAVAGELDRLNPQRIVIVGGASVVSTAVEQAARAYTPAPSDVDRIFGATRYETSRLLVADAFSDGVPHLFIATGRNFPDALAAGPASSRLGGAVLLVDGALTTSDAATRTLITALGVPDLHLAGGTGAISAGVQSSLAAHVSPASVTRYAGSNRYDTAAEINFEVFQDYGTDFAVVANGAGFADALAGGPLAAAYDAPLYLSTQACLRSQDYLDMALLLTQFAFGLGGPGALSDRALYGDFC